MMVVIGGVVAVAVIGGLVAALVWLLAQEQYDPDRGNHRPGDPGGPDLSV